MEFKKESFYILLQFCVTTVNRCAFLHGQWTLEQANREANLLCFL